MNVAIVSNGPGARLYRTGSADLVVAVNKAAARFACDWWVFRDANMWMDWYGSVRARNPKPPRVLTPRRQAMQLIPLHQAWEAAAALTEWPVWFAEDAQPVHPFPPIDGAAWDQYSGLLALGWLHRWLVDPLHFGHDPHANEPRVTLYGYDLSGEADVMSDREQSAGVELASRQNAGRWTRERSVFDRWISVLEPMCELSICEEQAWARPSH